jgi:hypothetical protein
MAMAYPVNFKNITSQIDFYREIVDAHRKAENYLLGFKWCAGIKDSFLYYSLGKVFSIFLFEIDNSQSANDNFLWVIVGDIPSMYLDVYGPKSTREVLEDYIRLAEDWITTIQAEKSVDGCFPFNAEPTIELAQLLQIKVSFMKNTLLAHIDDVQLHLNR